MGLECYDDTQIEPPVYVKLTRAVKYVTELAWYNSAMEGL